MKRPSSYTASNMYAYNVGLYHSSAIDAANLARIDDQKVDSLIEQAKTQLDSTQREATFTELSEYLNDWTPFVPLYQTVVIKAYGQRPGRGRCGQRRQCGL